MDVAEARETCLKPRRGVAPPAVETPARRLRHVREPLAMTGVRVVAAGWFPPDPDTRAAG